MEDTSTSRPWYAESTEIDTPSAGVNTNETPLMEQAKQQTQQVLHQTQQKAGQMVDQAKTQVKSQLAGQKERAAGSLDSAAQALRQTGQQLRDQDQTGIAQFADGAADVLERFTGYLSQHDVDQLLGEVESFARRQPALFLGGAFALGFMATRFLKSSSPMDGGMARRDIGMTYPAGQYQARTEDLAHPIDVVSPAAAPIGMRSTTGPAAAPYAGSTLGATGTGAAAGTTTPVSTPSTAVDVDDEVDLVTTTRAEDRSEVQP